MPAPLCPYVGLRPYTKDDREYFFGREREKRVISANLYAAPLTVLYGPSGVGKSSILRAGVVPQLESAQRTAVVYFNQWQDPTFLDKLKLECLRAAPRRPGKTLKLDTTQPLHEYLTTITSTFGCALLILLDQFEDYFLYNPESKSEVKFESEFAGAVNSGDANLGFLIGLRDDWLSRLDRFEERIPNLLGNLYRLEHLSIAAAEDAIRKPLEVYNEKHPDAPVSIESELTQAVLGQVRTGQVSLSELAGTGQAKSSEDHDRIETAFLQLVMERLWEEEIKPGSRCLHLSTFERLGGAKQIVQSYLRKELNELPREEQEICGKIFGYMVTPKGAKIAHETVDLVAYAERPKEEVEAVLEKLDGRRLLRHSSPPERYEIFHDVLAPAILEWRARYIQGQQLAEAEKRATQEAAARARELARQRELDQANVKAAEQRRQAAKLRRLMVAMSVALAISLVALIFADKQHRLAIEQQRFAAKQQQKASAALAELTRHQREDARRQKEEAERKAREAEKQAEKDREQANKERELRVRADRNATSARLSEAEAKSANQGNQALSRLNDQPDLALLLAMEAERKLETLKARSSLLTVLQSNLYLSTFLRDHKNRVASLAFTADGKSLVSVDADGEIVSRGMHDVSQDQPTTSRVDEDISSSRSLTLSADGNVLAAVDRNGGIKLFDVETGKKLAQLPAGKGPLAISGDGKIVAWGTPGNRIQLWNVAEGHAIEHSPDLQEGFDSVESLALSRDGGTLALVSSAASRDENGKLSRTARDYAVTLWDVPGGKRRADPFKGHEKVWRITLDPRGKSLAWVNKDFSITLFNVASERSVNLAGHGTPVAAMAFSADGELLALVNGDNTVSLWRVPSARIPVLAARELALLRGHSAAVMSVAFSSDGSTLASGGNDRDIILWHTSPQARLAQILNLPDQAEKTLAVTFSQDGRKLVTAGYAPAGYAPSTDAADPDKDKATHRVAKTHTWDVSSLSLAGPVLPLKEPVSQMALSPDGDILVSSPCMLEEKHCSKRGVHLWDTATGLLRARLLTVLSGAPLSLALSYKDLAVGGCAQYSADKKSCQKGEVSLWRIETGQQEGVLVGHQDRVTHVALSLDGRVLASGDSTGTILFWDVRARKQLGQPFTRHRSKISVLGFSPDGRTLVSGGKDGTIILWNGYTGKPIEQLTGPSGWPESLAFSPDGKILAVGTAEGKVTLWDVEARQQLGQLRLGIHDVTSVAFGQGGRRLAVTSLGTMVLWDLDLSSWKKEACQIANRNLTFSEWQHYGEGPYHKTCPDLPIHPSLAKAGEEFALNGDLPRATAIFRLAIQLEPGHQLDLEKALTAARAEDWLRRGNQYLEEHRPAEAGRAFWEAQGLRPTVSISADLWNEVCWQGGLRGFAAEVKTACEQAVRLDPRNPAYLDSRGLVRALTGDPQGAIADFQEFAKTSVYGEALKNQRQDWVKALQEGRNPFTPDLLQKMIDSSSTLLPLLGEAEDELP